MEKILFMWMWIITPLLVNAQDIPGVKFEDQGNWQSILAKAKKEKKMVFVDAYTTWCGPCKMMDKETYPNADLGRIMNSRFISIKVQMDSTSQDNAFVRSWYADAKKMLFREKINAFPTVLFYNADGELIHRAIGYKSATDLSTLVSFASDTSFVKQFEADLAAYKAGKRDFSKMLKLHEVIKKILINDTLAANIARSYKTDYLDQLDMTAFTTPDNLKLIREYNIDLVKLDDHFFKVAYLQPGLMDSILGVGNASGYVSSIISRDLLGPILYKSDKPITNVPNWKVLTKVVKNRYPVSDARAIILNEQMVFYRHLNNWDLYSYYRTEKIKLYPPAPNLMAAFTELNLPAWEVFEQTSDKKALTRALEWVDQAIIAEHFSQFLDTKGNLLYKLGRVSEAIRTQELAVKADEQDAAKRGKKYIYADISLNLQKMKKGEPTWPKQR
ncbi:DUF255 domain-containing protein [Chitinophaga oryziterrae]|uniref:DUF255 domain-containing protein n=1 Tax=Chitinophaga oryziterrae TaxID=1031224 RepID=A0A6N8J5J1_9BACT|nr:thioredoxin family protein [Chitinophaga oryziterrae]MVT40194.1 DUF255 domain-containing protein [Chitinophaga oryziterrae]